jgi:predicted nicotinamide N-methyase
MNDFSYRQKRIEAEGLRILVPDPLEVEDVYRNSADKGEWFPFPYWTRLWPAAFAMTRYLKEQEKWLRNKSVIEWGGGIGLPSFVAASWAKEVLLTDLIPEAMAWAEENVRKLNLNNVQCRVADWNIPNYPTADIVVLSDVSYDPDCFDVLAKLINHYLDQNSRGIIALPERIISGKFYQMIEKSIVHSGTYMIEDRLVVVASLARPHSS